MATKTHTYTVQKGDAVRPQFVGTKVGIINADSVSEGISLGHFESEAAIMAAANAQRNIAVNRVVRRALSKDDAKVDEAVSLGNKVKLGSPRAAATPKSAKPSTIRKNTAASSGNRLFEKCAADPDFLRRMEAQQIVDHAEFETWLANRNKKDEPKAAKAATEAPTTTETQSAGASGAKRPTPASGSRR